MKQFNSAIFLLVVIFATTSGAYIPLEQVQPKIFEDIINASVECVRGVLNDGVPEFDFPSLNPLILDGIDIDLDLLNIDGISGQIFIESGRVTDIASFVMTNIQGEFILVPPTYTVTFGLHYDQVAANGTYNINVTLFGVNIWGEGTLLSEVQNLVAEGYVKAIVEADGVHIQEFNAPITLETYIFNLTGLFGDEKFSQALSSQISQFVPEYVNAHPEIFTDVIAPIFIEIFNELVNSDSGIGLLKYVVQKCIIDIVFPPF